MSDSPRSKTLNLGKGKNKGSTFLFALSPHLLGGAAVASTELAASNKQRARKIEETMFVAMFVVAVCLFLYLYNTGKVPKAEVVEKKKVEAQAQKNSKYAALTKDTEIELEEVSIDVEEPQIKKL